MREIKFSILLQHGETGRIVDRRFSYADLFNGIAKEEINKLSGYAVIARREYIGLTDKHGKDIFEGDIIKADWHWEKPHAVKWPEDYYAYIEYGLSESEQHLEIIGNIYDNPELLKEEQA